VRRARPPEPSRGLSELGRAGDRGALAHYQDPAYYAKAYSGRRKDVDFYVQAARHAGGPVLEYGVGNGRVAIPMARAGAEVVGVDLSRPMLSDLAARLEREPREVRERVSWVHGDMRSVRLGRRFALVVAPFNTVLHLYHRREIEAFFSRVREHLAPTGRWVFDFSVPQSGDLGRDPTRAYRAPRFRHPTSGELTRYAERFEYDPVRQLLVVDMEFLPEHGAPWTVPLTHRQFFPQEMEALLHYNGFQEITFYGDFSAAEPGPAVDSLAVSCRLARPSSTDRPKHPAKRWSGPRSRRRGLAGLGRRT
jgi:SAM-dependent methyltransferase